MIAGPPEMSSKELGESLGASRGAISQATRVLEQIGFVRRVRPGLWDELMRRDLEANRTFLRMAERGLNLLESDGPETPGAWKR